MARGRTLRPWLRAASEAATRAIPAGTWRAAEGPYKLRRPATVPMTAYTGVRTVDLGPNGTAPKVVLNASGAGTAQTGPQGVGETWTLAQCSVSTNKGQLGSASTCTVYVGPAAIDAYQVAANLIGGGTQFALGGVTLTVGDYVFAVWAGGATDGSEIGTLKVTGQRTALVAA